ncbi:hypothetical protein [uncultured Hyphomicrobium sp.]|uniref:hypothetical protein n=1 Tax=uncultured Hyphomicrobium sp. TaxID=194373 RepID=UPI0025D7D4E1|nr:hypothetical protein [uncultured Hyphomicrobium sp.]
MSGVKTPSLDLSQLSCLEQCRKLYDAYTRMLMGGQKTQIRHGDYWVEFRSNTAGDMDRLRQLYGTIRAGCPEALKTMPDLNPSQATRRGGPATHRILG